MTPRNENPALYRENIYKSWKLMSYVVSNISDECFVAHLELRPGVYYDCLCLVTRDAEHGLRLRFMLNRNGINSNILDHIWERFDDHGCAKVAEDLIDACGLSAVKPYRKSSTAYFCDDVVAWIEKHRNENFCIGPIGWHGGCHVFLDYPSEDVNEGKWPITDHGPELSLGIDGVEIVRFSQTSLPIERLATSIACCSEIAHACSDKEHPCHKIVSTQKEIGDQYRQVPEAWAGNLVRARVLFVSSNPSISMPRVPGTGEDYPLAGYLDPSIQHPDWPIERVIDFQINRLDQSRTKPLVTRSAQFLCQDGLYRGSDSENGTKASQKYWKAAISQVESLVGPDFDLSRDICMTEIVHCKSKGEQGVAKASGTCSQNYLGRILELSGSLLVLIGGAKARTQIHTHRSEWQEDGLFSWDVTEKFGFFRQGDFRPSDHVGLITLSNSSKVVIATEQLSYASNKYRCVQSVIGETAYSQLADYLRSDSPVEFESREEVLDFLGL